MADTCGLGPCFRPAWLQRFATSRYFLIVYGLLGTIQAMATIYFVATLTTLEKRFKIPSKTTGIVMSGNEISQILLSLTLSYYGGQGNRPLWIAWGVALSGISCYILAIPHIIYGPGENALALTEEYLDAHVYNKSKIGDTLPICTSERTTPGCQDEGLGEFSIMPLILIFLSQFVLGIGSTMYYSLGQPYLDDNVKKTRTPMLLAWVLAFRTLGPVVGLGLGAVCLKLYIDPTLTPVIGRKDPRWLGAWWLGWTILGTVMLLFSILIAMFPKELPKKTSDDDSTRESSNGNPLHFLHEEQPLTKAMLSDFMPNDPIISKKKTTEGKSSPKKEEDFQTALKRLLKNKLLITNIVASIFYILGATPYMTFIIKYLETQYQQSASGANVVAGSAGILASIVGFLISGYVLSRFKPQATWVLGWNVIVGCVYIIGELSFIFLSCSSNGLQGFHESTGKLNLINTCNSICHCENLKYTPVCDQMSGTTFYSACHAGCHTILNNTKGFTDCSCLRASHDLPASGDDRSNIRLADIQNSVLAGPCQVDCGYRFILFIIAVCAVHMFGSSGKIGNVLVNYRCVTPRDKSFAQGLALLCLSLFAFIPGPILYGAIIDSACLVWDESCGKKGNCWLYQNDDFRIYLNLTAAGFTAIGMLLDIAVWWLGRNLDLYEETDTKKPRSNFQQLK